MNWRFWRRTEARQASAPYADAIVAALQAQAMGQTVADANQTAALEAAAGAVARAFAGAAVRDPGLGGAALTPGCLALIGRDLVRRGESLHLIEIERGMVRLIPIGGWDVRGGWREADWSYRVDLFGPSGNVTRFVSAAQVLHCRYAVDPARPWHGLSPLAIASATGRLMGSLEYVLANEAGGPHGHVIPVPDAGDVAGDDAGEDDAGLPADIAALKGGTALVETTSAGYGEGRSEAPKHDWQPKRIGADPPDVLAKLRTDAGHAVLAACGVPVELIDKGDGSGQKEAWRRFVLGTVAPMAATVAAECRAKLDAPALAFDFDDLRASDVDARARAFRSMVQGGMAIDEAAAKAGLMASED